MMSVTEVAVVEVVVIGMIAIIKVITSRRPVNPISVRVKEEEATEEIKRKIDIISKNPSRNTNAKNQLFTLKINSKTRLFRSLRSTSLLPSVRKNLKKNYKSKKKNPRNRRRLRNQTSRELWMKLHVMVCWQMTMGSKFLLKVKMSLSTS